MNTIKLRNLAVATMASAVLLSPTLAGAAQVSTGITTITRTWSYPTTGDFVVQTNVVAPGCDNGFFMKASDPGYKLNAAAVLSALTAGKTVVVYAESSDLWPGSSTPTCHITAFAVNL